MFKILTVIQDFPGNANLLIGSFLLANTAMRNCRGANQEIGVPRDSRLGGPGETRVFNSECFAAMLFAGLQNIDAFWILIFFLEPINNALFGR
jgi:hypothetical protein